jgi:hypothetical protein
MSKLLARGVDALSLERNIEGSGAPNPTVAKDQNIMTRTFGIALSLALSLVGSSALASVVVVDNYWGGLNTYNPTNGDVIGTSVFDTQSASFSRTAGGNTLQVTINTNYAGAPGTPAAEGTGYGALFLTPGAGSWHPSGIAPYTTDQYTPGEWKYAFTIPQVPGANSGSGGLYSTTDGTVVMSNVNGSPFTYPNPGNPGYFFRQGQAVQFTPNSGAVSAAGGGWSIQPGKINFSIDDNHALGDSFSFSWAMTCANDVIQGQVSGVPEGSTWALMVVGFGGLGAVLRRRRSQIALTA